jgi:hypothetical protein
VRLRLTSVLVSALASLAAAGLAGPAAAGAASRHCARPGTVTLASTSAARVFRPTGTRSYRLYGCLKSLDRAYRLDHNSSTIRRWGFGVGKPPWAFGGRFVGFWVYDTRFPQHYPVEFWVYSLRSGRMAVRLNETFGAPESGLVAGPLLAANGVPVWIGYAGDEGLYSDFVTACMDAGVKAFARPCGRPLGRLSYLNPFFPTIDLGRGNYRALRNLRVSGTTVRWTDAGKQRQASVAALGS